MFGRNAYVQLTLASPQKRPRGSCGLGKRESDLEVSDELPRDAHRRFLTCFDLVRDRPKLFRRKDMTHDDQVALGFENCCAGSQAAFGRYLEYSRAHSNSTLQ